ncbi:MAG: UDP-N-acetylmuramoyl-tripeptide--D-alanyl-D-alanine ligase [Gammaproteobacteria bacterium]
MFASEAAGTIGAELIGEDVRFEGCTTDSRQVRAGQMFIALKGERFDGHDFLDSAAAAGAAAALVEEAEAVARLPLLKAADVRRAMGTLAGYWRGCFDLPLIALTGSNGKTTVKEMIGAVLSQQAPVLATQGNLNNDIGVPLTLFDLGKEHRFAVIEMGANHPGEIDYLSHMARPTVALITQCAPAHLEGFGSVEGVAKAKGEIFHGLVHDGIAIINADDDYAGYWSGTVSGHRRITFGLKNNADVTADNIRFDPDSLQQTFSLHLAGSTFDVKLALPGRHNIMNALAAAACCHAVAIPPQQIQSGLERVSPVKGRLQVKMTSSGVRLLDDTYNANPASLEAGLAVLSGYPGRHWLVLGDMGELGEAAVTLHEQAGAMAREYDVERVFAAGELTANSVQAFGEGAEYFDDIESLIRAIQSGMDAGTTILIKGSRSMAMDRIVKRLLGED